ncbi:MAG: putative Ig domain-containing protein [Meiothermus sp.]|uniref:putative Ig domain-containing protein n=1 Tax=Meiothermus sp. TaxID=1955249 RepID=UPI0025FF4626|nr:putative Ig domain-containing protein [Meiothermus sp.]MCS7057322.1 putative Ig domain-containing protein [Meiothermus sp.]MCS7194759.1 putative Ig domain-containing protein [Meiothermus sp.]MDW8091244.1 putative Ig domain-containing protein [Meiothermus sp.]MDW8480363.1 putative Ig domain-containing protein [Meiothermus sp.]
MRLWVWGMLLLLSACGSDSQNNQTRQPLRLTVRFETGYVDEPYSATLTADGGVRPYRFTLEGNLPKGLTYSGGRLSGTPQEKGSFELIVSVEDANLSSRTQKVTLVIGDTPPPRLEQVFPLSEVADPFPYLFRVRQREARGFQAQIPLRGLRFSAESFKADSAVLYVLRYDEARGLLDIDAAFTGPRKDFEAFRFTAVPAPDQRVRPELSFRDIKVVFYDKNGKLAGSPVNLERTPSSGRYRYSDLEAIARNWGRRLPPQAAPATPPQGEGGSSQGAIAPPSGEGGPSAPPSPNPPPPTSQTPPAPSAPAQRLEGDLSGDGVVDQKDLELLRSSYAWAGVGTSPNPGPGEAGEGEGR